MSIQVQLTGPLFHGEVHPLLRQMVEKITYAVTAQVSANVHYFLNAQIKHPTPYYETQIRITDMGKDQYSVNDSGVVYGPWLEGVSYRNQVTRFKGYHSFRKALQQTSADVPRILRPILDDYERRMS